MNLVCGWVLTMGGIVGIISLHKDYVPLCVMALVAGALLMQGGQGNAL